MYNEDIREMIAEDISDNYDYCQKEIIQAVIKERERQDVKWGMQNHPLPMWTGILGEEYGELCEAINETVFDNGTDLGGYNNMRKEAIQVAAVAVAFLEYLERSNNEHISNTHN